MRILGLDTSTTSTGYAVIDNGKILCYGTIKPPKDYELLDKIIYIEKEVKELLSKKKVEFVVVEELSVMRNGNITKALAGLLYHLLVEFQKRELLVVKPRPSEWRAICHIKGKKREELKQSAINYVQQKYNIIVNDDEADAICIAEYGENLEIE